jgi:predicted RNA methylase
MERYLNRIICGDCLEIMKELPDKCVDLVLTDPPYGCGKADWDDEFPRAWYSEAKRVAPIIVIITGSSGLKDSVALAGDDFIDVISARNMNGMTRGPIGFGNWLAAVIACGKPEMGPNAFDFVVKGEMPSHPSPKPIQYMKKLVKRITRPEQLILDPFLGSGTTAVAAAQLGRKFIGIEISPEYCRIAKERLRKETAQLRMFVK